VRGPGSCASPGDILGEKGGECISGQSLKITCYVRETLIIIPAEPRGERWAASAQMTLSRGRRAVLSPARVFHHRPCELSESNMMENFGQYG
jgi:hypothetical protein